MPQGKTQTLIDASKDAGLDVVCCCVVTYRITILKNGNMKKCICLMNGNLSWKMYRSRWPRGLRHEPSSLTRRLGLWVQIPIEAWISVCVYSVFVLFCVQVAALRRADPPPKES
jgi:hypothetical protein